MVISVFTVLDKFVKSVFTPVSKSVKDFSISGLDITEILPFYKKINSTNIYRILQKVCVSFKRGFISEYLSRTSKRPYSPSVNGPSYKQPETLFTSLRSVFRGEDHLRFFDHRFIGIWVLPIALTGIVFEILLIAPTNNTSPFN